MAQDTPASLAEGISSIEKIKTKPVPPLCKMRPHVAHVIVTTEEVVPADDYWAATKNGTLSVETSSHESARLRGMFHATFMLRYKVHVACKFI